MLFCCLEGWRSFTPPSVLPDISPTMGEIGSVSDAALPPSVAIGEGGGDGQSPPLRGRCPAGQRGVGRIATPELPSIPQGAPYPSTSATFTFRPSLTDFTAASASASAKRPSRPDGLAGFFDVNAAMKAAISLA